MGNQTQSPASILLWGSNDNAPQPSPSPTSCIYKWEHSSLPQIGDFVSTDQPFGLSVAEYGFEGRRFEGILGLNYPNLSFSGAIPIFDKLKNQGAISEPELPSTGASESEMDNSFLQISCKMFSVARKL